MDFFLTQLAKVFPDSTGFPAQFEAGFSAFLTEALKWNNFFPVIDLLIVFGLVMTVELVLFSTKIVLWGIHMVRGN